MGGPPVGEERISEGLIHRRRPTSASARSTCLRGDGTLLVIDMYRGVIQDGTYWTDYLRNYIKTNNLELPVNLGRIWRVVHESAKRDGKPSLTKDRPRHWSSDSRIQTAGIAIRRSGCSSSAARRRSRQC